MKLLFVNYSAVPLSTSNTVFLIKSTGAFFPVHNSNWLAPYSGEELRTVIQKEVDNIQIEIKKAAQKKRAELEEQLDDLIHPQES